MNSRSDDGESHESRKHAHRNAHGGLVLSVGKGHVEAVRETGGRLRLYALGEDETVLNPIPTREIRADALPDGSAEAYPLTLTAEPQPGEPDGASSTFAGKLPESMARAPMTLSMILPLEGRLHRVRFRLEPEGTHATPDAHAGGGTPSGHEAGDSPAMPDAASPGDQERLYRTPGGRYTKADIRANGTALPSEKFKGLMAKHDLQPAAGDRVCPITNTKANPRFAWVVNGQTYLFCCPPCIDEFVLRAKTAPESIQPAAAYTKS